MPRGTQLQTLRSMLKAELGEYSGTNTVRDAELNLLLSNMQQWLSTEVYWPFLQRDWNVVVNPGQQYPTLPTVTAGDPETETVAINLDKLPEVSCFWNQIYTPVEQGIGEDEYNAFNFALGQSSDPIQRWRYATNPNETSNPNTFEVWPVPVTQQTLRFVGERALLALVNNTDTADLDDLLIVLFTAAELLSRGKKGDFQTKLQRAQRRLQWLRQGYSSKTVKRTMDGQGDAQFKRNRHLVGITIAVH